MNNNDSNRNTLSWIERMVARSREALRRMKPVDGGAKNSRGWMIGLVVCALLVGGISLAALGREGTTKGEATAAASPGTPATAAPAKTERNPKVAAAGKESNAAKGSGEASGRSSSRKEEGEPAAPNPKAQSSQDSAGEIPKAVESEQESGELIRARAAWFHDQRAYPFKHIPAGALQRAIEQRDLMKQRQKAAGAQTQAGANAVIPFPGDALWHLMGPQPVNELFSVNTGFPTASGRVTAIAVDPSDATGQTAYIGGAAGGVWKTTNGGTSWVSLTDSQPSLAVGSIALDPNNPQTIYVGTGEENFNVDAFFGVGVLKSINGGTSWTQQGASTFVGPFNSQVGAARIGAIAVDPNNSSVILAGVAFGDQGSPSGIYRSADGGSTWSLVQGGNAGTAVVFDPMASAKTAYAALGFPGGDANNGIYKSIDEGATWTKLTGAALPASTGMGRITLAFAPSTTGATAVIYAAIADASTGSNTLLGLFQTTNGGTTWAQLGNTPAFCNGAQAGTGQCFYDMAVGVSPASSNFVVVGGGAFTNNSSTLFRSTDGGVSWTDITVGSTMVRPHVDTHAIVFAATGGTPRLYIGNDGGMWRTDNASAAPPLWVDLNATLAITQFYPGPTAAVSDENYGFGGTQDNDTELFSGLLGWQNELVCGDGGFTAIDQKTPTTIYTGCNSLAGSKIKKAVMNGQFVTLANSQQLPGFDVAETAITSSKDAMEFIPPIALDEGNPENLYFATCRVWMTNNAASSLANSFIPLTPTWAPISGDLSAGNATVTTSCPSPTGAGNITTLDIAHSNSSVIVAGTSNGKVWETTTGGAGGLWTEIDAPTLPARHITAVRTKRDDSTGAIVYATFSGFGVCTGCGTPGHVFKTTTAGTTNTWTDISGDLPDIPVNDIIVFHQSNPTTIDALYIATDVGVFACPDPEAATPCTNWTVIGDGLPNSPVLGLAMRRTSRILRAATHGRSMWQIQLTGAQLPTTLAALSGITPAAVNVVPGGAGTTAVTVTGLNFSANTQVQFAGTTTGVTTAFVNTTQLNVTLSNTLLQVGGIFPITLIDPAGVDPNSSLLTGFGGPFAVMNPLVDPSSMTPVTAQTYTAVPFTFTSATSAEPFLPNTVLAFYDTSTPPVLQFTLPTIFDPAPTITGGGTTYKLTTAITDFTTPFTYHVVPYNPTPGGGIDDLAVTAAGAGGLVPFTFTVTANPNALAIVNPNPILLSTALNTTSTVLNVSITNPGGTALMITAQSITGTNLANFSFAVPTTGTSCNFPTSGQSGVGTITLAAGGGTCNFGMTYFANPTTPGNANSVATLNLTDNGSGNPQAIPITGVPLNSTVLVAVSPVNFGAVTIGTTSPTMNATLINLNSVALNVNATGFTISGANKADFHFTTAAASGNPACPALASFALAANSLCDVGLNFTPSIVGPENATINVADDGPGSPQNAPLLGVGVEITSISPSVVATGGPAFTLTVNGGGFAPSAVVNVSSINGTNVLPRLTTFVSANQLLASIPASDIATAGSLAITVTTPVPGGTTSEPKTLVVAQAPVATNDNINFALNAGTTPARITQDTTQATIDTGGVADPTPPCGSGSKARSVWFTFTAPANGRVIADTRFSSYTTIGSAWTGTPGSLLPVTGACVTGNVAGTVPASLLGFNVTSGTKYFVMVTDATVGGAGGTLTASLDFASVAPANDDFNNAIDASATPFSNTVNSIEATTDTGGRLDPAPSCAPAGAANSGKANSVWYKYVATASGTVTADTLTSPYETILTVVTGAPGAFTEQKCNVSAGAGIAQSQAPFAVASGTTYFIMVSAVLGDGGTTNFHLSFTASAGNPVPTLISFSPANATAGGAGFNLIITGSNFVSGATGTFNGAARTVTFNSSTQVTMAVTAPDIAAAGSFPVIISNPAPGGGPSAPMNFPVNNPAATLTSLSPSSTTVGGAAFNLIITGSNFVSGATGTFNGNARTVTFNSSTQVTMAVTAPDIATAGSFPVNVSNPGPGGGSNGALLFSVNNVVPTITSISPTNTSVGGAGFNMTVTGTGYISGSSVKFNGTSLVTTFNSATQLTAAVTAANLATIGTFPITVTNPSPGGGTSNSVNFTVNPGPPATMTANAGTTPQSATINTAFANALAVTVKDAGSNPVPGVNVTFTAPGAGASGVFSNSTATIIVATNASGIASASFTANATAGGPYTVTAAATGLTTVNFSLTNTAGAATTMTANAGTTPQSTAISTAFANALAVTVKDAGSNPVAGVNVTFAAPGSGASGVFSNSTATIIVATNASGVASASFTANAVAGGPYTVTAAATSLATVNFSLTNTSAPPATITANAGTTPQSATINTAFANALAVTVKDAGSNPVAGANVTFAAPGSGASGVFSNSTATIIVATNALGVASAPFTANSAAGGPYIVTATVAGVAAPANFSLTNNVGAPATMTPNAGTTPQSATVNTAFANALAVTVKDAGSNPVPGVNVTFTAPGSGASGVFSNSAATIIVATNASGVASASFTANATAGGPFTVTAAATGLTTVNFSLTNKAGTAVVIVVDAGTTPQSATINTAFANPLAVTVKDAGSNPVPGVNVTFTAPGSGASGVFSNSTATITIATNASGIAPAPFTANSTAGGPYMVSAASAGLTTVNFSLTNTAGGATTMTANAGTTPQSATISTAFANALAVTVKDAGSNPVAGVNVTFTAPGSGASGVFSNSTATIIVATNVSGIASAPFTANTTAGGPYTVTAASAGLTTVNFSLTNTAGAPTTMTANAGTTPQSTAVSTAFTNAPAVTVKDASSNPVPGVNVTFTAPGSGASGVFSNSTATIVVATNASGVAGAPFTANATVGGPYTVTAAATGLTTVNFSLTNTAGPPTTMTANAGTTPQSATINTAFTNALAVTVKDAGSNPVSGVNIMFTAPGSGASGKFSNGTATITVATNASGVASAPFTANLVAGGAYTVTASATGLTTVNFLLTNLVGPAASVTANAGTTPQSATISTAFANPLAVTVKDAGSNPVPGVNVAFTAPGAGASGVFSNSTATITVATNASGVASAVFTANATSGGPYNVAATVPGVATAANFALTNNNPVPSVTSFAPPNATAGGAAFALTINGANFVNGATGTFNGIARTVTFVSAPQVTMAVTAADIAAGGNFPVVVSNPGPGGGASAPVNFTVNNPVPTLTSLGQTHASGGATFNLTVNGAGFITGQTNAHFNGKPETSTVNSSTQLTASVAAADVATAGTYPVVVVSAAPGGGPSTNSINFTVDGFTVSGPANTPVKAGQLAMITITVTPTSLADGFNNPVSLTVSGLPAHATATFSSPTVTPGGAAATSTLTIMTTARGAAPPSGPIDPPVSPLLRLLPALWLAAMLAGLFAMHLIRRTPLRTRYGALVPLALLLVTGAILAGCTGGRMGTPAGPAQLTITATSGTMVQTTPANSVTLTVQ